MNLPNTELEGVCITDSQEPGYSDLCTTQELGSLWRYPPCVCLSRGRRWSQGAGGGGELCPNYGEQEHLISFLGAALKPNFPRWNFCHFSFSSTEHTFPLKAIFKNPFLCVRFFNDTWFSFPEIRFCSIKTRQMKSSFRVQSPRNNSPGGYLFAF